MTFTREQLIEHITGRKEFAEECVSDSTLHPERREYYALSLATLEIALATLESRADAEPVAWVMKDDLADADIIFTPAYPSFSDAVRKTVGGLTPLYTRPQPAPVVTCIPPENPHTDGPLADGWNACRAAMLQGKAEPVSQPYTLPLDYLQGYKDGCEWSALMAEANHPQTGDWLYDDPLELAKAIRKGPDMLPTASDFREIPNSSTNNCRENADSSTNGWIPCSERMPDEGGRYWCYVEEINSLGKSHYQWNCSWNGDAWSDPALTGRVTHWLPLPAAPQQEV